MKRGMLLLLSAVLALTVPVWSFAASTPAKNSVATYNVNIDSIEDIVAKNSSYVKDSEQKIKRTQEQMSDAERKYRRALKSDDIGVWTFATQYQSTVEDLAFAMKISEIQKTSNIKRISLNAKQEYIKYLLLENEKKAIENKKNKSDSAKNKAFKKYQNGVISYREYRKLTAGKENFDSELKSVNLRLSAQSESIKRAMGLDRNAVINIQSMKAPETKDIIKINLDEDAKTAYEKSISLKVIEEKIVKERKNIPTNEYNITDLNRSKNTLSESIYAELKDIKANVEIMVQKLDDGKEESKYNEEDIEIAKKKYQQGLISKSNLDDIMTNGGDAEVINKENIKLQILERMLRYNDIKMGYLGGSLTDAI